MSRNQKFSDNYLVVIQAGVEINQVERKTCLPQYGSKNYMVYF